MKRVPGGVSGKGLSNGTRVSVIEDVISTLSIRVQCWSRRLVSSVMDTLPSVFIFIFFVFVLINEFTRNKCPLNIVRVSHLQKKFKLQLYFFFIGRKYATDIYHLIPLTSSIFPCP